jgi:hypothetical protein
MADRPLSRPVTVARRPKPMLSSDSVVRSVARRLEPGAARASRTGQAFDIDGFIRYALLSCSMGAPVSAPVPETADPDQTCALTGPRSCGRAPVRSHISHVL